MGLMIALLVWILLGVGIYELAKKGNGRTPPF